MGAIWAAIKWCAGVTLYAVVRHMACMCYMLVFFRYPTRTSNIYWHTIGLKSQVWYKCARVSNLSLVQSENLYAAGKLMSWRSGPLGPLTPKGARLAFGLRARGCRIASTAFLAIVALAIALGFAWSS